MNRITEDGKHTRYLKNSTRFRNCDPELYDGLRQLLIDDRGDVISKRRHLATVEGSGLLPSGTLFFSEPLRYQAGILSRDKMAMRSEWLARALRATANADVVFVDPDNGIECQSVTRTASAGPKHIFWGRNRRVYGACPDCRYLSSSASDAVLSRSGQTAAPAI